MQGLAVALISVGVWLIYTGVLNLPPLQTLQAIIKTPGNADVILSEARIKSSEVRASKVAARASAPGRGGGVGTGGGGAAATPGQAGTGNVATVLAFARQQIGKPYRLGGAGPDTWDCSGLVKVAFGKVGFNLPHNATTQMNFGTPIVSKAQLQPGDLLFPSGPGTVLGGHVQIYTGNGQQIEAPRPGVPVVERAMWGFNGDRVTARRLIVK